MAPSRYLIHLLSFSASALAITSEEASLIAWKAYGQIMSQFITANAPLTKGTDFIYVTPPTSNFVRGGTPCPESVTNMELYNLVDPLQNSSSPLLGNDGPGYVQTLETYLQSVNITDKVLTPEQQAKLDAYEAAVNTAKAKFQKEKSAAFLAWKTDEIAKYYNQSFQSWIAENDPQYSNFQQQMVNADATYNNFMLSVYGSQYNLIQEQRKNINDKAQFDQASMPGYNMMVYPSAPNYLVNLKPFVKQEITDFVAYRPAYTLGSYENVCDAFYTSSTGNTVLQYNYKNVDGHDWSTLGYSQTVKSGGAGFFGILGIKASATSEVTHFNSWSSTFTQEVSLTMTMKGAPQLVPINTGFWDVGNVRKTYPKLRPGEVDGLAGRVRLTHALVGYQLSLSITFKNTETWRNVTEFIEKGKKNVGGGIHIFGFSFGAGGGGSYQFSTNDIKTNTTVDGGILSIPTTPEGMIFMLGARGKAL
ncbi:uncharacterized protein BDR25DRAFT_376172 [Lindgomyces ingoldianus]|uniref:Uncharacterized protein n=1 Tax=Lindgomyces ingoldianus TaxID=673940 RepID=A0ACB6QK49_9PLEO|nr:uncharacterized protein BDR25DRAFT_376172 [Lindgomyces ingoldianus]KAF2467261.1 hypothetical protein BDR25DRAFT_376172 [Lindgomyces ingoldianus]